jgi:CRISPR-associated protein Cas5t
VVLRTLWRVKSSKEGPGLGNNRRPDFQELLTDVRLSVWVREGAAETAEPTLAQRLGCAVRSPASVSRFGGLALGESTHLVNDVRPWRSEDPTERSLLVQDNQGDLSLPIWPDHVGSKGTRWGQFRLAEKTLLDGSLPEEAWVAICPPEMPC